MALPRRRTCCKVAPMPPEDFPPLAPFPDLSSAKPGAPKEPSGEPPLLSDAQRKELTRAAGSLEGKNAPVPAEEAGAETADDFLLTSAADPPATPGAASDGRAPGPVGKVLPEEPVMEVDFLALPGGAPETGGRPDG